MVIQFGTFAGIINYFINTNPEAAPYLQKLGFSEGYRLLYCIAFGHPDETPDAKPRKKGKVKFVE